MAAWPRVVARAAEPELKPESPAPAILARPLPARRSRPGAIRPRHLERQAPAPQVH